MYSSAVFPSFIFLYGSKNLRSFPYSVFPSLFASTAFWHRLKEKTLPSFTCFAPSLGHRQAGTSRPEQPMQAVPCPVAGCPLIADISVHHLKFFRSTVMHPCNRSRSLRMHSVRSPLHALRPSVAFYVRHQEIKHAPSSPCGARSHQQPIRSIPYLQKQK